ncbi:hypothetical protein VPH35_089138 [Triticum aestivum]
MVWRVFPQDSTSILVQIRLRSSRPLLFYRKKMVWRVIPQTIKLYHSTANQQDNIKPGLFPFSYFPLFVFFFYGFCVVGGYHLLKDCPGNELSS